MMQQSPITYLNPRRRNAIAMTRWTWGLPSSCPCSPWLRQLCKTLDRCTSARPMTWAKRRSRPRMMQGLPRKESGSTVWATRIRIASALLNSYSTRLRNSIRSLGEASKPWCVAFAVRLLGRSQICGTTCAATLTWSPSDAIPVGAALLSQVTETVTSRRPFVMAPFLKRRKSLIDTIMVRK